MTHRFVVVSPPEDGWRIVHGSRWYLHGGRRYRDLADAILAPHGGVHHLDWTPDASPGTREASMDALLPETDALVVAPWLGLGDPELPAFGGPRLDLAPNLRVVAGTFDFRLGWLDLDETERRGIAVVDTSRTMTPSVAEFGVAITFALLRDIPAAIDVVRSGSWPDAPKDTGPFVFRDLADCRVGLAGYGSINRHYRRFIEPYGCEVRVFDPLVSEDAAAVDGVVPTGSLVELARASDILVVDPAYAVDARRDRRERHRRARSWIVVRLAESDGCRRPRGVVEARRGQAAPSGHRRLRPGAAPRRRVVPT